jgi:glucose/arabinose dehydrogenase
VRELLVVVLAIAAVGCSGEEKTANDEARAAMTKVETTCAPGVNCMADRFRLVRKCTHPSGGFRACTAFTGRVERSRIEGKRGSRWAVLFDENTAPKGGHGWWRRVIASPDRRTLLAQWSGECEIQFTYIVTLRDRTMRLTLEGLPSTADGWGRDGRARVRLPTEGWATKARRIVKTGIYRVNPANMAYVLERRAPTRPGC